MRVIALLVTLAAICGAGVPPADGRVKLEPVWSGHPVGFALLTHGNRQFAAYYDAERRMKVAARTLGSPEWDFVELPQKLGWDSHNYVTIAIDDTGFIHLSGNMHVKPLVYFRTTEPLDIHSFAPAPMVGDKEDKVTYPSFFRGPANRLIFTYRDGSSGKGDQIYNVYDHQTQSWRRLLDTPLTSGQGKMNAYLNGPVKGPDGRFHLCWVWRDNPGCESNHDPCYARSDDLVRWETAAAKPLELPITLENADIVDPVPAGGGIINGNVKLGFDAHNRVIVSYHKYDEAGFTQIYNARFDNGAWKSVQATKWDYRWDFNGGGSIVFDLRISGVAPQSQGLLRQTCTHSQYGRVEILLDEESLKPAAEPLRTPRAGNLEKDRNMITRHQSDSGRAPFALEWMTLPHNRDKPREGQPPPPSMLYVVPSPYDDSPK